ncbi:MAG: ABC transporter permease [Gemmatimonadota bacterium]|nr:ABC transporter permease [Gemmatimonadota bacterium]
MTRALLRSILRLGPAVFRERYGAELLAVHDERAREPRSVPARAVFACREVAGLIVAQTRYLALRRRWARRHSGAGAVGRAFAGLGGDVRFGLRTLGRSKGFAAAAIAVLALGIGANSAIFSAVNAFLFRPLPFDDADRLVMLYETNPEFGWEHAQAAPANVLDWREQVDALEDVALYSDFVDEATLILDGEPELLGIASVTGNFFDVLGARPALGRGLSWDETWEGRDGVVVLSHSAWQRHFGGDPEIVGRSISAGTETRQVVGVMPEGFAFPSDDVDIWAPWGWEQGAREQVWFRRAHFARPIGRLAAGVDATRADAALQVVVERLKIEYPETNRVMGAGLMPLRDFLIKDVRAPLYVLVGAVGLLLLLACINVANLMLVRASDRARDVALRLAVGAGRGRVARQMLVEGGLLALVGGALGLALGWIGVRALSTQRSVGIEGATEIALDARVILFTFAAAVSSALLFGIVPALRAARGDVQESLKEGGRAGGAGRRGLRTAGTLVAGQVAVTLLLVLGAGLMVRTFLELRSVDPGFTKESVLAVQFSVPAGRYDHRDDVLAFQDEFARLLEARPGIERVGFVARPPLGGQNWSSQFQAEGWPPERVGVEIWHRRADEGYFEALDIPLIRGRHFTPDDGPEAPLVVVINETFASQHFPGEDPIGQRIAYDRSATAESIWYEIVGIVADQHQRTLTEPPHAEAFENRRQDWGRTNWAVVKTGGDASSAGGAVRAVLAEMDPLIPIEAMRPMQEVWRSSMARWEFLLTLLGVFAVSALLLAIVGVYGVTAQAARKRTHEIGIRVALGARTVEVLGLVLRQGLTFVGAGLVVGVGLSLVATRAISSFLYGVEPTDPLTIGLVVGLLAAVGLAACLVPARRAAAVDPASSLRSE